MKKHLICTLTIIFVIIIIGLYSLNITLFNFSFKEEEKFEGIIVCFINETNYKKCYKIKINNKYFLFYISKKEDKKMQVGDKINFSGKFSKGDTRRNYKGFNYDIYLKSKKIMGIFNDVKIYNIEKNKSFYWKIKKKVENIRIYISNIFEKNLNNDNAQMLKGLIIGEKSNIDDDIVDAFRKASLSHILAISGAHFAYIILLINFFTKILKRKRIEQFFSIIIILFFMILTGNTPSIIRAGTMSIISILASVLHRKNNFFTSFFFSLLIQIIYNPYVIFDVGLLLSYLGTIGIVLFYDYIYKKINLKIISTTLAANLAIFPILVFNFNSISLSFVFSNIFASILLGPIIIIGLISIIFNLKIIFISLNLLLNLLILIAKFFSSIKFLNLNIEGISISSVVFYYAIIIILKILFEKEKDIKQFNNLIKNILIVSITILILLNLNYETINSSINNTLLINFIDVNQGDSCLIRYKNKTIIVDGGGNLDEKKNVGKTTLLPYLLNRKIKKIDYMIFSHFDNDHSQGLIYILENNIKVKNIIIGAQYDNFTNYVKLKKVAKEKNVNIIVKKAFDSIKIDKENGLKLIFLWPIGSNKLISENAINNNSLVFKVVFNNFSMLFTGDIESIAEKEILKSYNDYQNKHNINLLNSTILKVAHHGSDTSSSNEFIEKVNPKIALIGVGKNNKFKHPSDITIKKLNARNTKIYRTDMNGEISIKVFYKSKMNDFIIKTML